MGNRSSKSSFHTNMVSLKTLETFLDDYGFEVAYMVACNKTKRFDPKDLGLFTEVAYVNPSHFVITYVEKFTASTQPLESMPSTLKVFRRQSGLSAQGQGQGQRQGQGPRPPTSLTSLQNLTLDSCLIQVQLPLERDKFQPVLDLLSATDQV